MTKRTLYFFLVWVVGLLALLIYPPCNIGGYPVGIGHYFLTDVGSSVNATYTSSGYERSGWVYAAIAWDKLVIEALIWSVIILAGFVVDNFRQKNR